MIHKIYKLCQNRFQIKSNRKKVTSFCDNFNRYIKRTSQNPIFHYDKPLQRLEKERSYLNIMRDVCDKAINKTM